MKKNIAKKYIIYSITLGFIAISTYCGYQVLNKNKESLYSNVEEKNIAVFIDGQASGTLPTSGSYGSYIVCSAGSDASDSDGYAAWDSSNSKWNIYIRTTNIKSSCKVYFTSSERTLTSTLIQNSTVLTNWTTDSIPKVNQNLESENALYHVTSLTNIDVNTVDDTGAASYVFRGAVDNNFVEFAGKCWRAVRIDGEYNTKLVLYNNNTSNAASPCTATGNGLAFISGSKFNDVGRNTLVGYMYADSANLAIAESSSYDDYTRYKAEHSHDVDSKVLTNLKSWYDTYFVTATDSSSVRYQDYLADVVWCNDLTNATGVGYHSNNTNYGYRIRQYPTLQCNSSISRFTSADMNINSSNENADYKMGLLTADEVAFAGGNTEANSTYYLNANAKSDLWWTMTPGYADYNSYMWIVRGDGSMYGPYCDTWYAHNVRPSVALKSTAKISATGDGTSSNPYVVTGF